MGKGEAVESLSCDPRKRKEDPMFKVICFMLLGIVCGVLLRRHDLSRIGRLSTIIICVLLFVLGAEVGLSKDHIEDPLFVVGMAVAIAVFSLVGSVLSGWLLLRGKKKRSG